MTNVIQFPHVNGAEASGRSMPGLTTPELRARAILNFYSDERRRNVDPLTAWERSQEFGRDLDRIWKVMGEG